MVHLVLMRMAKYANLSYDIAIETRGKFASSWCYVCMCLEVIPGHISCMKSIHRILYNRYLCLSNLQVYYWEITLLSLS